MDLLLQLVRHVISADIATGEGVDVFADYMPDSPDEVISFYEYHGSPTPTGAHCVNRSIQVLIRGPKGDVDKARGKAWEVFNFLDTPLERVLDTREDAQNTNGTLWAIINARQTPARLREDSQERPIYSFNLSVITSRDYEEEEESGDE